MFYSTARSPRLSDVTWLKHGTNPRIFQIKFQYILARYANFSTFNLKKSQICPIEPYLTLPALGWPGLFSFLLQEEEWISKNKMLEETRRITEVMKQSGNTDPAKLAQLQEAEARLLDQIAGQVDGYVDGDLEPDFRSPFTEQYFMKKN